MTAPTQNTILIAYDGSISARAAIERAGRLFPGSPALVVTVWSSVRAANRERARQGTAAETEPDAGSETETEKQLTG